MRFPLVVSYFNSTSNHNLRRIDVIERVVVSYFNSTSNHNGSVQAGISKVLFLISILHQTTTVSIVPQLLESCFLFQFYIKPQLRRMQHSRRSKLFLISILHQTTTKVVYTVGGSMLFLISILHQTTTSDMRFVDCHSVMWPNERYERRMTGRGSRNDAGFVFQRYFSLKVECTSRARNRYMFAK